MHSKNNTSAPSRNSLKFVKIFVKIFHISSTCSGPWNVSDDNIELNMCINARMRDVWCVISERCGPVIPFGTIEFYTRSERSPTPRPFYNTILSQITTKCVPYARFSVSSRSCLFLCIRFVFWYVLHDLSLRNRTRADPARSLFVRVSFPASVSRVSSYTHVLFRRHDVN